VCELCVSVPVCACVCGYNEYVCLLVFVFACLFVRVLYGIRYAKAMKFFTQGYTQVVLCFGSCVRGYPKGSVSVSLEFYFLLCLYVCMCVCVCV